jgi:hypothetical protein
MENSSNNWPEIFKQMHLKKVVVYFDGSGDSGQVESIDPTWDPLINYIDKKLNLKDCIPDSTTTLEEFIDKYAYKALDATNTDWYNNDGGFGEITFDVDTGEVTVDMNVRISTSHNTQYVFEGDIFKNEFEEEEPANG